MEALLVLGCFVSVVMWIERPQLHFKWASS